MLAIAYKFIVVVVDEQRKVSRSTSGPRQPWIAGLVESAIGIQYNIR